MNQLVPFTNVGKAEVIAQLARDIPLDRHGIPSFILRPDLLPPDILDPAMPAGEKHEYLNTASVRLEYTEGFPTLPTGEPFWEQFEFEPPQAYDAFVKYLEMTENPSTPIRQLGVLSSQLEVPKEVLQAHFHMFWWKARAKAHDLFIIASHARLRQRRVARMEMNHFDHANDFISLASSWLKDAFQTKKDDLKPADIIKLLDLMMKAQRVSLGLPAHGLSGTAAGATPQGASLEVIMRQLSDQANGGGDGEDGVVRSEDIRKLLQNPDDIQAAQELIIKFTSQQEGGHNRAGEHFLDRFDGDEGDEG